jgi:hypothetical protein
MSPGAWHLSATLVHGSWSDIAGLCFDIVTPDGSVLHHFDVGSAARHDDTMTWLIEQPYTSFALSLRIAVEDVTGDVALVLPGCRCFSLERRESVRWLVGSVTLWLLLLPHLRSTSDRRRVTASKSEGEVSWATRSAGHFVRDLPVAPPRDRLADTTNKTRSQTSSLETGMRHHMG